MYISPSVVLIEGGMCITPYLMYISPSVVLIEGGHVQYPLPHVYIPPSAEWPLVLSGHVSINNKGAPSSCIYISPSAVSIL